MAALEAEYAWLVIGERREAVVTQVEVFRAIAAENERTQRLGSMAAYSYPQSLGEWLGTAVQLAGSAGWQAHWALRPLATYDEHERMIAEQGRGFIELYGAVLAGALGACDELLDREDSPEVELPEVDSMVEMWDQARDERDGFSLSVGRLGEAVWIYGACLDRDAALLSTATTKLLEAMGLAALALAVADEPGRVRFS